MQAVCDVLEQKDRARLVYLAELPQFDLAAFARILDQHGLSSQWNQWAPALGLKTQSNSSPS